MANWEKLTNNPAISTNAVAYCAGVAVAAEIDMELKQVFTGESARGGNVPP